MDKLLDRLIRAVLVGGVTISGEVRIEFNQKPLTYQVECKHCGEIFIHNNEISADKAIRTHLARWCPALHDPEWERPEASEWPEWLSVNSSDVSVDSTMSAEEINSDGPK